MNILKIILGTQKRRHSSRGFSLIEVVIGIAVITLVITAAAEVTRSSIKMGSITTNELIAHNLAEEGLEIVRNIRDSNWIQNNAWNKSLAPGEYVIAAPDSANFNPEVRSQPWRLLPANEGEALANERFNRRITIAQEGEEKILKVKSTVKYNERRKLKEISMETVLTDWKQGPL